MRKSAAAPMAETLEALYETYNRRAYLSPDPLEFLYRYDSPADREVVGLIASSLAYGRVASILASIETVLAALGGSPAAALAELAKDGGDELRERLDGFVHRFTDGREMAKFLHGIGRALNGHGSLERLFLAGFDGSDVFGAMERFADAMLGYAALPASHLLPRPSKGSACKRLALYLRWMTRQDDVDPGGWRGIRPRDIIVPLDTHMHRIARGLGFVTRRAADGKAAREVTAGFRAIRPDDPARYDFTLTRFGIRAGLSVEELLCQLKSRD